MITKLTSDPVEAARFIREGRLAAFPTETVYGLGADALDAAAVHRIFTAKERPADNPLIVHVGAVDEIERLARTVPPFAHTLVEAFFPGPLTVILPRVPHIPAVTTAGLDTVGIRMPDHPIAQAFLRACGRPVAAPSANRSGRPSPTRWQAVRDDLGGRIDCILKGSSTRVGVESTVVDCSGEAPVVLRAGGVTVEALMEVLPNLRPAASRDEELRRSPGTRHRHYAPDARVVLVDHPDEIDAAEPTSYIGLTAPTAPEAFTIAACCPDVETYARRLFAFFRESERQGVRRVVCQRVDEQGLGAALMDRLRRAARDA